MYQVGDRVVHPIRRFSVSDATHPQCSVSRGAAQLHEIDVRAPRRQRLKEDALRPVIDQVPAVGVAHRGLPPGARQLEGLERIPVGVRHAAATDVQEEPAAHLHDAMVTGDGEPQLPVLFSICPAQVPIPSGQPVNQVTSIHRVR